MNSPMRTFLIATPSYRMPLANLVLAMGALALASRADAAAGPCSKTSEVMLEACNAETRDDYWVEIAKCINLSSDRKECRTDAHDGRDEAQEECLDVFEARGEVCEAIGEGRYDPDVDPDNFVSPAAAAASPNPFLPLIPGAEWVYQGGGEVVTVTVTNDTKMILGITTTVVRDVVTIGGIPIEDTLDWYAQDEDGNVWYMGELSQNFEDGELVDLEGSWEAGVDDAKPGIAMPASPEVGDVYRQEFALGEAEDVAEVLSLTGDESTPESDCNGACLVTAETVPLEPDALEHKYYVAGIGFVLEIDPESGERGIELISANIP